MTQPTRTPPTLPSTIAGRPVEMQHVFDPAMRHYVHGYRFGGLAGDAGMDEQLAWNDLHLSRSALVLRTLMAGPLGEHLVLRGSWLLHLWLGAEARLPHDLDFVAVGGDLSVDHLLTTAANELSRSDACRQAGLLAGEISTASIWAYEKIEGRRLVIPWVVGGRSGAVQVDLTVDEDVPLPLEHLDVDGVAVRTVSMEMALVWKLMWLATDGYPQGKDLFDAVLLTRHTSLSDEGAAWLRGALAKELTGTYATDPSFAVDHVEWQHFHAEYPAIATTTSPAALDAELRRHVPRQPPLEGFPAT